RGRLDDHRCHEIRKAPANVIAAQPRARRLVEIVRFNAQDAREFSDPLVRDAIASVLIAADLPWRYVGGVGKLAHCHPAMLTVFLQALSDVCVDGALAIHRIILRTTVALKPTITSPFVAPSILGPLLGCCGDELTEVSG